MTDTLVPSIPPPQLQEDEENDDSLIVKPALPLELVFYQSVTSESAYDALRPYIPKFYGLLKLEGQVKNENDGSGQNIEPVEDKKDKFKIWMAENVESSFVKPYILRLPLSGAIDDASSDNIEVTTPDGGTSSASLASAENYTSHFLSSSSPLDHALLQPILEEIIADLQDIREAISEVALRLTGSSLLIIYESDADRAKEGVRLLEEGPRDDDEDDEDDDTKDGCGPPCIVRLVDFSEARFAPQEGPDEAVLKKIDGLIKDLEGKLEELEGK